MKDVEIEIRVRVENISHLVNFLKKNSKFIKEEKQIDEYFTPTHRDFLKVRPVVEWLRLRKTNKGSSITYKHWYHNKDGKSNYCDEFETKVEDFASIQKIFGVLNLKKLSTVDKVRKIWRYKDYEISLDKIKNLGDFIEIEYKGKNKKVNPDNVTSEMIKFLKKQKVGKIKRNFQGYSFQLIFPDEIKEEIV